MNHPELPRLMSRDELCEYLGISADTSDRWIREGYGPPAIKVGQRTVYPLSGVVKFIDDQMTGNKAATPAAMQAALLEGSAQRRAANAARTAEMVALDRADREGGVTPLTMGTVGATPGMQQINLCPPVAFDNRSSAQVAVDNAANGRVPVPWQK